MAELSELVELWNSTSLSCRKLEIEPCKEKYTVIFSSQERGISRYNLETRRVIQSWPFLHGQTFATSVLFQEDGQRYIAVTDEKIIYTWTESDGSLSNASTSKLNVSSIKKLHPVCFKGVSDIILVEKDGRVHLHSQLLKNVDGSDLGGVHSNRSYIWSNLLNYTDEMFLLVIVSEGNRLKVLLSSIGINEEHVMVGNTREFSISMVKGCHLISTCLQENDATLITLWSDQSLCTIDLKPKLRAAASSQLEENDSLNCQLLRKLPSDFKLSGKGHSKAKIATMNNDLVVIASRIFKDKKSEGLVSIWSTRYGTEQATCSFPLITEKDGLNTEANILNLACVHGYIVLALSTSTLICSYEARSPSLAGVIGKLKLSRNSETLMTPLLIPMRLRRPNEGGKFEKKMIQRNAEEKKMIGRLSNPLKTPTLEEFTKELDKYLDKFKVLAEDETRSDDNADDQRDENGSPKKKKRKMSKAKKGQNLMVPEHFTEAVLNRCLNDKTVWSRDVVMRMIKTTCINPSLCSELMKRILDENLLELMQECFRNIKGIPENCIATCVKYLLRVEEKKLNLKKSDKIKSYQDKDKNKVKKEDKLHETDYILELLIDIIKYPCDERSLQDAFRSLSLPETGLLLQALHLLLLQNPQPDGMEKIDPPFEKVIEWTSMIVSAHFTSLILSQEMMKLMQEIQNSVQGQLRLCSKLRSLEPYLRHFKQNYNLPDVEKVGVYTIETLTL